MNLSNLALFIGAFFSSQFLKSIEMFMCISF
nr:MAG TPA: hypothetical protein [Caudoviricetes sp.]